MPCWIAWIPPGAGYTVPVNAGKVVVTGASGGVGSALIAMFRDKGVDFVGVDLKPAPDRSLPWQYADLAHRDQVLRILEGAAAVVHLGEIPNLHGPYSPDELFARNTRVTSTVFQCAAYQGVGRIVYASSAQVYGCWGETRIPPLHLLLDEDHPVQPINAYAMSKVANEGYLRMVVQQNPSLGAIALRFPGVMGMYWPWELFVDRLHEHDENRDGLSTYVHIHDLCEAFCLALDHTVAGELRIYNVLAEDIANLKPIRVHLATHWPHLTLPEDHPEHGSWAVSKHIRQDLGWQPKFSVHRSYRERHAK